MNGTWEKTMAFIKVVGFPTAVAAWLLYEFHTFARSLVENQSTALELLRRLIDLHK